MRFLASQDLDEPGDETEQGWHQQLNSRCCISRTYRRRAWGTTSWQAAEGSAATPLTAGLDGEHFGVPGQAPQVILQLLHRCAQVAADRDT
jgi:hypothetical protein